MPPRLKERYKSEIVPELMREFSYRNIMQVPRVEKVTLNIGLGEAKENARESKGSFEIMNGFEEGFGGADVIYAKSWGALLTTTDEAEGAAIIDRYKDWITDGRRMAMANEGAIFMHPLPADRNIEVTDEVIDGPRSAVWDEAENRLHAQKAILSWCLDAS